MHARVRVVRLEAVAQRRKGATHLSRRLTTKDTCDGTVSGLARLQRLRAEGRIALIGGDGGRG